MKKIVTIMIMWLIVFVVVGCTGYTRDSHDIQTEDSRSTVSNDSHNVVNSDDRTYINTTEDEIIEDNETVESFVTTIDVDCSLATATAGQITLLTEFDEDMVNGEDVVVCAEGECYPAYFYNTEYDTIKVEAVFMLSDNDKGELMPQPVSVEIMHTDDYTIVSHGICYQEFLPLDVVDSNKTTN